MNFIRTHNDHTLLLITVQPGARKDEVVGLYGDPVRLKVKISAPPVDGAANEGLVKFLAKLLGVSKSKIQILRGETSKQKDLLIAASAQEIAAKLQNIIGQ